MNTQPGPIAIADDLDRMYDQLDPVDDWRPAISAACDELRRQHAKIKRLTSERDALRGVPTELIACLIDARDDVAAELQRCREAAGYPSTDRRLEAQETLLERVDAAIASADQWLAQQRGPLTDEEITRMWMAGYSDGSGDSMVKLFARAIERAHGIGLPTVEDKPC